MNKWLARLLGIIIVVFIGLFFYDGWFNPEIPRGLADREPPGGTVLPGQREETAPPLPEPPQETISLTSLQDMESSNGAPPPVLTTPQGTPPPQSETAAQPAPARQTAAPVDTPPAAPNAIRLESLAAADSAPAPAPSAAAPSSAPAAGSSAPAWIQAGSFGEKENAERLAASIRAKNMAAVVEAANVNGKTYHRVYVGPVAGNRVADTLSSLSAMGINARQVNR